MKHLEAVGENYFGHWAYTRTACRAIIVEEGKILLSYETVTDQWMIPGGGIDPGEGEKACCLREVAEETVLLVKPGDCLLELDEYYEDRKFVSLYFVCKPLGTTARHLTDREREVGMEPRWIPLQEAKAIFSRHRDYAETDEMRRGMYLREYTALCELEGQY